MKPKKEMILKFLKKHKKASTWAIMQKIKSSQWQALKYLEVLVSEGKIKKIKETLATYWELTNKGLQSALKQESEVNKGKGEGKCSN